MISFQSRDISLPPLDFPLIRTWLHNVADSHNLRIGSINYLFCSDDHILQVNRQFLRHDYYTDIITFDYTRGNLLGADIVISLDTVYSNAASLSIDPSRELHRVIVHGLLHLCGINDKGVGERPIMEAHENQALSLLDSLLNPPQQLHPSLLKTQYYLKSKP